ncbi:hypothetical protein A2331_02105 [Candidatus Falkowbacteria bacterium RIFOXYB2_FULL_34_18]|uniref:Thiamine biosynthesis protein ThiS n=1 Tax=Candidatus Falkowbacteria bacterium RIFOXYD2_FULL_34_120 TaxID=1798007 RepID=A0A1F5TQR8_9BACT|nr:MAG: hypothetical protein A2331_02105 [Candidatus Falkowbacteria bacterium RIFOXYB2_FULL_34_18]OGF29538.1 MAG: hypothetical protein A2500_02425 [Candidatus Falkowbacteria bacterium RIFOXYC12_FULL_34_55]OGF36852.1 MAG: hypothetical protein A2466_06545 [Candidatus Falkowbacteria bacterium RIFOXYC2_FULL_34_220]OGF39051.1 MAG: hypothetical protein A2515_04550 [Candidatus Falkowbacteria bacterium RIFOXYD12_FULL_34_57]OGF41296.1 MAG: hypothetical protein A2531_00340 [Candidatus Falkowbacteria bact
MIKVGETQVFYQEGMTISGLIKELKIKSIYTKVRIIQKNEKDISVSFDKFDIYVLPDDCEVIFIMIAGG